ncbi:hypothetical protein DY000_02018407 [Brassica cretica]|uniref:Uncharacterized protein n=1 Tax=Brassica cretica TaxID=69181 RepID=A0ABQ7D7D5_BRACR|nr:hypothetical protein DY000_02018407 [Brassica cretica]
MRGPDLALCSPHIEAPSPGCPPDLLDIVFFIALLCFFDTFSRPSLQTFTHISTLKPPSRMATKNDGGGGLHVEEKFIVIFSPMNMDVAGYDFPLVPRLNQSLFLIFSLRWNELNEQASLVLQGSSSHLTLFSTYGAVCMVL